MKKLLEKLLSGEGKLSLMLLEAKTFAEEAKNEKFLEFIENEINGYSAQDLPDYRKITGSIIGTITDAYGRTVKHGPINFSKMSESVGFDLTTVYMIDGIGFIEDTLVGLDGSTAVRAIPSQLVEMLNKTFKYNNPNLNLTSASHEINTASVKFILTKVRQELILGLQKLKIQNAVTVQEFTESVAPENQKSVFVTYAWEDDAHNDKVISFVDFLRKSGYNATMDKKESQEESSINLNKMMIEGIQNSDKVIIVLSPTYKEKANKFIGGVGTEFAMIVEEIKTNANKFIFVSFGQNPVKDITPTGIGGREVLNLKKDQDEAQFNNLFAKLESKNILQFSNVSETTPDIKLKKIEPFKL